MIVTVTLNPAVDVTLTLPSMMPGLSHRLEAGTRKAGGKGINVARILHREGVEVVAIAPVGGDIGRQFSAELAAAGIPAHLVAAGTETRTSTAIYESETGRATLFNEYGNPLSSPSQRAVLDAVASYPDGDCLVVAGSLPRGTRPVLVGELVDIARGTDVATVVDTSGEALLAAAGAGATVVKANRAEITDATGLADPLRAADVLLAAGARWVVVTSGSDGMVVIGRSVTHRARPPAELVGNPTGAGDAATAAIADSIAQLGPDALQEPAVVARAVAWASSAVLAPTAGELAHPWTEFTRDVTVSSSPRRQGVSS